MENLNNGIREWRDIEEASNYEVSNYGEVRNKKTKHILIGSRDKAGYLRCVIRSNDGELITRFKHRLAAIAFLENPDELPLINHKDENKANNYVGCAEKNYSDSNLEWCTHQYNMNYGSCKQKRIETIKRRILNKELDIGIGGIKIYVYDAKTKDFINSFPSITSAAKQLNADYRTVVKVLKKERRQHLGMIFSYAPLAPIDNK